MLILSVADDEPLPLAGSTEEAGLDRIHCFDSFNRLKPYGNDGRVNWDKVSWGTLQESCVKKNEGYSPWSSAGTRPPIRLWYPSSDRDEQGSSNTRDPKRMKKDIRRKTAIIIRSYEGADYTTDVRQHIRALITETALYSGGRYTVYLLVEVKNTTRHFYHSEAHYQETLNDVVPREFRDISILWSSELVRAWYPDTWSDRLILPGTAMQLLALQYPRIAHYWELELDVRFTGHWYDLLFASEAWSKNQPRKYQWERAEKFYIPWYHGSWTNFSASIAAAHPGGGIWGPLLDPSLPVTIPPRGPKPPNDEADNADWGVGEEPDILALQPITDYTNVQSPGIDHKGFSRKSHYRVLCTMVIKRLSRRMLLAMHDAQLSGLMLVTESFPPTMALHHGFKVVVYPTPNFFEGSVRARFPEAVDAHHALNDASGGMYGVHTIPKNAALRRHMSIWWSLPGGVLMDVFPQKLYERWLGRGEGEEPEERLCLPGMLLHTVKGI